MTFSRAVYGQALDNESSDPAKADGVWLEDPHNAASQEVVTFVMNVKATGRAVVSTRNLVVTQSSEDGLVVEARCNQPDSGGRDTYLVYCEPSTQATLEAMLRAEFALNEFAKELSRELAAANFSVALKQVGSKRFRNLSIFAVSICVILAVAAVLTISPHG
jgi:hypothetical protein